MAGISRADVVVIGGGFTGLAAARALTAEGVDVVVVDSFTDHLGGRAYSYDSGDGLRFDHGAQYVGDLQNAIMAEVRALGPEALVNGAELRLPYPWEVMVLDQQRMPFKATDSLFGIPGCPPQLGFLGALEMVGLLAEMTIIECCIDTVQPWEGPASLLSLDQVTVWDWVKGKWWIGPEVADLVRISVEALLSVEPSEISLYYFLWYCACNDGFLNEINDSTGGPQQYWLRRGTLDVADRFAAPVKDRIKSGVSVSAIALRDDDVELSLDGGDRLVAKKVVVATSPATAARRIAFTPPLPEARRMLLDQPMGRTLKCQIYYRTDWWHHTTDGKAYDGYVGGADYPVLWVMDNSPPGAAQSGGPFVLMTFTVGAKLDELGPSPTQQAIEEYVTGTLATLFGDERALSTSSEFISLTAFTWDPREKDVGGGPNTVFVPGRLTGDAGRLMNEPWEDKVFFASAESCLNPKPRSKHGTWDPFASDNMPKYDGEARLLPDPPPPYFTKYSDRRQGLGYMDGAILSGEHAALQVLASLGVVDRLPETPAPSAITPPTLAPHDADLAHPPLAALVGKLAALTLDELKDRLEASSADGRLAHASWLREAIVTVLRDHDVLSDEAHLLGELAAVRDFIIGVIAAHKGEGTEPHHGIRAAVESAEKALAALFSP